MRWISSRLPIAASVAATFVVALAVAFRFPVGVPAAATAPSQAVAHTPAQGRLLEDIKYLASDELEGRGIGTAGLNKAAQYIRREFQAAGLDVTRVHGDAFQTFTMTARAKLGSPNSLQFTSPDGQTVELKQDVDFRPCSFGGSGKIDGELAFGGYAIDSSENNYHDFKGGDFKGKAVIIMRRVPRQADPHGVFSRNGDISRDGDLRAKLNNATAAGASALLVVNDPFSVRKNAKDHGEKDPLMTFGYGGNGKNGGIPVVQVTDAACDRVLKAATGKTLAELEEAIDTDLKPHTAILKGWKAEGVTTVSRVPVEVKNVIGVLEGEGPHADETVVVGAHYDHLGRGGFGSGSLFETSHEIHNGADDNASGTTALIEVARHFGHQAKKLPRRLVFIAFTGEEEGLIGSAHYVKEPVFPLATTVAMVNLDMVGRLREDKLTVYGVATADHWKDLVERATAAQHLHLIPKPEGFGPSDHSSFYGKKIPVLFFFTGTHSDYHRPTDDWQKINIPGMDRIVDVVEDVVTTITEAPQRPAYIEVKGQGMVSRGGGRPYFGSIPDFGSEAVGYSISDVAPGGPAARAGLKGGDRIVKLGDRKISGLDDFDLALRKFTAGDEIPVVVIRAGKTLHLKVVLDKPK